jgi:leader peptidase (prepilin peptidase) / N-methyltransferase
LVSEPHVLEPLTTTVGAVFAVVLGLLWGSFANVCIYRWPPTDEHPKGRSVVTPGSHCSACQVPIRWYDNVPILSYLWLRGQCRACKTAFSPRYLLVEALTAALFGVVWWFTLGTGGMYLALDTRVLMFVLYAAFVFVMVVVTFIDIDHKLILNKVTIPSIVLAYGASLLLGRRWWEGLLGIAIGYGVPWLIGEIYYRLRGREGLGLGDGMLLALVGALLGWRGVVFTLFGGSLLGSVIGILVLMRSRADVMRSELPFGPFLAAAATVYLFAEPWVELYFRLL